MISVIVYGRNDNYGYNLHKRVALSLNCIAELLADDDDEIVFVDYNTPDDFPTFPEAIRDTLTRQARRRLRILRIRPALHRRFKDRSHLAALEPIARNVALRRSNPANRWVLSTNTDMIFTPHRGDSLSGIATGLADGYYGLPRFELPESLWETLDRRDPCATIAQVAAWGWELHLNEVVTANLPAIRFDAPGDFQLMLRDDLFRIHGFDERMLLGWHVDSNIAVRLHALHGTTGDLSDRLYGYHCDHTRQVTPAHRPGGPQNDWPAFVTKLDGPAATHQEASWGLAGETIEEIGLDEGSPVAALRAAIGAPQAALTTLHFGQASYDRIDYDARHVLPFLFDALISQRRDLCLGWFGAAGDLLARLAIAWRVAGFTRPILLAEDAPGHAPAEFVAPAAAERLAEAADMFVFDFAPPAAAQRFAMAGLRAVAAAEHARIAAGMPPRRLIAVNAVHSRMEPAVHAIIGATLSPVATRLRQGFLRPDAVWEQDMVPAAVDEVTAQLAAGKTLDLMPGLAAGKAGVREGHAIRIRPRISGFVFHGPYIEPPPGRYRVRLGFAPDAGKVPWPGPLRIEAISGQRRIAARIVVVHGLRGQFFVLDFTLSAPAPDGQIALEIRAETRGRVRGSFTSAELVRRAPAPDEP